MRAYLLAVFLLLGQGTTVVGPSKLVGPQVVVPGGSGAVPSYNQGNTCVGANGTATTLTTTCVFSSNVTSGNEIAVYAEENQPSPTWNTPTKSSGTATIGTFTIQGTCPSSANTFFGCLWVAPVTGTGSATITISVTFGVSTSISIGGSIAEVNNNTQTVDMVSAYGSNNSCTSCSGSTLTTGGSNRIVLTFVVSNVAAISAASPFTAHTFSADGNGNFQQVGSFLQTSAGTYSPTWTIAGSGAQGNVSVAIF